jgi:hypothetical protein
LRRRNAGFVIRLMFSAYGMTKRSRAVAEIISTHSARE